MREKNGFQYINLKLEDYSNYTTCHFSNEHAHVSDSISRSQSNIFRMKDLTSCETTISDEMKIESDLRGLLCQSWMHVSLRVCSKPCISYCEIFFHPLKNLLFGAPSVESKGFTSHPASCPTVASESVLWWGKILFLVWDVKSGGIQTLVYH